MGGFMANPYIGEIQVFAVAFVPENWIICDGSLLQIRRYVNLFALLGTTFGGDGNTTFGVPNLVARVAFSQGQGPGLSNYKIGTPVGSTTITLSPEEMPVHVHPMQLGVKSSTNSTAAPSSTSNVAIDPGFNGFVAPPANTAFATSAIVPNGSTHFHSNHQPTLAMVYCMATTGEYPHFD